MMKDYRVRDKKVYDDQGNGFKKKKKYRYEALAP